MSKNRTQTDRQTDRQTQTAWPAYICWMVSRGGVMFSKLCSPNQVTGGCRTHRMKDSKLMLRTQWLKTPDVTMFLRTIFGNSPFPVPWSKAAKPRFAWEYQEMNAELKKHIHTCSQFEEHFLKKNLSFVKIGGRGVQYCGACILISLWTLDFLQFFFRFNKNQVVQNMTVWVHVY